MTNETKVTYLPVSAIKVDPACQARASMNDDTVAEYVEIMREKGDDPFPAIVVLHDGTDYWLSDGFHRYAAAKKAELDCLKSRIRKGTRREAILNSVGANASHGLRRTNADKRRAVSILLEDEEWSTWSNREVARRCGVDEGLVRKVKDELGSSAPVYADNPQIARRVERKGTAFEMETAKIGKKDAGAERSPLQPDLTDDASEQIWEHAQHSAERDAEASDDEQASSPEAQFQELMSAWSRASEEVRRQFLASIRTSLAPRVEAGPVLTEHRLPQGPNLSEDPVFAQSEPLQATATVAAEPRENALFEIWKNYKPNTQVTGRQWVIDGCPSEYRDSHFTITERLEQFRAAAIKATQPERDQFLELSSAVTA